MSRAGLLVSIDGPGGAGKSTVLRLVSLSLTGLGLRTCPTAEPTPTPLGNLIRASTDTYSGMSLACLVAGDRHHHLDTVIRPNLDAGVIVLTDRYLPSSLVLQRIDGTAASNDQLTARARKPTSTGTLPADLQHSAGTSARLIPPASRPPRQPP
jgi:dTMP kinase